MGAKVALQQGTDEEEAGEEDEDADLERRRLWGANKRAYHGANEVCPSSGTWSLNPVDTCT